jgi:hypothetical protein
MDDLKKDRPVSLRDLEGAVSPHQTQLDRVLEERKAALDYISDVSALAEYMGGNVVPSRKGTDWTVRKEMFPGVDVYFLFTRGDGEVPASFRALYAGERATQVPADNLIAFTIVCLNHMLRFVRKANPDKKLPDVCYRV